MTHRDDPPTPTVPLREQAIRWCVTHSGGVLGQGTICDVSIIRELRKNFGAVCTVVDATVIWKDPA